MGTRSTEVGVPTWGQPFGTQDWGAGHTELGAGRGLGVAGWIRGRGLPDVEAALGFGGLEPGMTGSGGKLQRGRWVLWWRSVWALWVGRGPSVGTVQRALQL